jgi:hypothetical protein
MTALFRVVVDNHRSNEPLIVHLTGIDPELANGSLPVHPSLPAGGAAARMRVDPPLREPGEQPHPASDSGRLGRAAGA